MKYNDETSMNPLLQVEIQECLAQPTPRALARLEGIATALHALTGECWSCVRWASGYVFVNEDETECISAEL